MGTIIKRLSLLVLFVGVAVAAEASDRLVLMRIEHDGSAWSNSRVYHKLAVSLTRDASLDVEPAETRNAFDLPFPADPLNEQAVADWAQQYQAQFVVVVQIQSERLERRKSFSIPLIMHKYETWGVIEGELRVIDVNTGKQVRALPFKVEQVGPRQIQASMDDDINDPDLHQTAPDKLQFFSRLEDKLVSQLVEQIRGPIGRYDREYVSQPQTKR